MKLVLGEGKTEVEVLEALCDSAEIKGLTIEPYNGKDQLAKVLRDLPKRTQFVRREIQSLLVLRDADQDPDASWHQLKDAIQTSLHVSLDNQGVFHGKEPKVAGFLVCGSSGCGELEDLCLESFEGKLQLECLDNYVACIESKTDWKMQGPARFRALMASMQKHELYAGKAAEKGLIDFLHPCFEQLIRLLRTM